HRRVYGYQLAGREVQLVNARVTATGKLAQAHWPKAAAGAAAAPLPFARRDLLVAPGMRVDAPVYRFDDLVPEQSLAGPAIAEYRGSTLFLPDGWNARIDERRNAHLTHASTTPDQRATRTTTREAV